MHVAALRPARTQNAHGGGAAARSGGELEPDLLPALLPHAGRPSESGSLPHAGAARILQNRSARTAGAACRRIAAFRSVGTAGALSARHLHAQPRPQFRISGGQIRHRTDAGRSLAAGRHTPGQPPRTAAGASRGILRSGRVRHGARHGLPHGRGDPAASSASRPRITGGRTIFRESQATTGPSVWGLSRPTSSASTSSRCCNSPTAATPDAKPCATAP